MKKMISFLFAFLMLTGLGVCYADEVNQAPEIWLYAETCPEEVMQYAREHYNDYLTFSIESGGLAAGECMTLGKPFTIANEETTSTVYYFPIVSDNEIMGTFGIYIEYVNDSGEPICRGIMSQYLAKELNQMQLQTSAEEPGLLYVDNGNLMVRVAENVERLQPDRLGAMPTGISDVSENVQSIMVTETTETAYETELVSPLDNNSQGFLVLDLAETQGSNEWCFAYASSAIIRYVKGRNTPLARDVMEQVYNNPTPEHSLNMFDVVYVASNYALNPEIQLSTMSQSAYAAEINANRPVFMRCQRVNSDGTKSYHAMVLRGYHVGLNMISIWNPWHDYYETMDATTKTVKTSGIDYTWINTIYNWKNVNDV